MHVLLMCLGPQIFNSIRLDFLLYLNFEKNIFSNFASLTNHILTFSYLDFETISEYHSAYLRAVFCVYSYE